MNAKKTPVQEESTAEDQVVDFSGMMKNITPIKASNRKILETAKPSTTPKFSIAPMAEKPHFQPATPNKDATLADYQASTPLKAKHATKTHNTALPAKTAKPIIAAPPASEFSTLFGATTPIDTKNKRALERPKPAPIPRTNPNHTQEPLGVFPSDHALWSDVGEQEFEFLRPSLERDVLRKLRQGEWPVQAALDFHGCTLDLARERFVAFMQQVVQANLRCVRMVHGKGLGSKNGAPIIKPTLRAWLIQQEEVLAFCPAKAENGGHGAALVLLRAKKPT